MKKILLLAIIGLVLIFSIFFIIKWGIKGENYKWNTRLEYQLMVDTIEIPLNNYLYEMRAFISENESFDFNDILTGIKMLGWTMFLPYRLVGGMLQWFFI